MSWRIVLEETPSGDDAREVFSSNDYETCSVEFHRRAKDMTTGRLYLYDESGKRQVTYYADGKGRTT